MTTLSKEIFILSAAPDSLLAEGIEDKIEKHTEANIGGFEINEIPGWMPRKGNYVQRQNG